MDSYNVGEKKGHLKKKYGLIQFHLFIYVYIYVYSFRNINFNNSFMYIFIIYSFRNIIINKNLVSFLKAKRSWLW